MNREEFQKQVSYIREEIQKGFTGLSDSLLKRIAELSGMQKAQLDTFSRQLRQTVNELIRDTGEKLTRQRDTIETRLLHLQNDNNEKLEKMRQTVDEKLHKTLETRLAESFKMVSENLESVHKGLGEMQQLAAMLNSLHMGFRTLAVEKRSSEVWKVLGAVKAEFSRFGDVLEKARNKIAQAGSEIDTLVGVRTRQIQKRLQTVEQLPVIGSAAVLETDEAAAEE